MTEACKHPYINRTPHDIETNMTKKEKIQYLKYTIHFFWNQKVEKTKKKY